LLIVVAVTFAAAALILRCYGRELGAARSAAGAGSRIASTRAGPVGYADQGAGLPLLSVHGAGGGHDQGLANVAELVGDGFRIIAPSRFGYLGTPVAADTSPAAQADAHAALLDELRVEKAIVVGVSAGARSAVELAIRNPERVAGLILIVPATYASASAVAVDSSRASAFALWLVDNGADFAWWATAKIAPSILIRFVGVPPELLASASPVEQARVMRTVRAIEPLSRRTAGIRIDGNPELRRPAFNRIEAPTLVISTRDDLFNTLPAAAFAAAAISNARLIVYETGGHLLVGRRGEARAVIRDFISREVRSSDSDSVQAGGQR
jgi:pimeloyl-ACP methyl ester carboxylesterase